MTSIDSHTSTPAAFPLGEGARRLIARLGLAVHRWRLFTRTRHELESCTDQDLRDLGIARSDILRIARETARAVDASA